MKSRDCLLFPDSNCPLNCDVLISHYTPWPGALGLLARYSVTFPAVVTTTSPPPHTHTHKQFYSQSPLSPRLSAERPRLRGILGPEALLEGSPPPPLLPAPLPFLPRSLIMAVGSRWRRSHPDLLIPGNLALSEFLFAASTREYCC